MTSLIYKPYKTTVSSKLHSIPGKNWHPSLGPDPVITDSLNETVAASFLPPHSLNFFLSKTSLRPLLSSLSFIYHIFCPTETFQRGRESHQSVTRRVRWPHRKLLIPAGVSRALENCQTQWTQCWCWSTIARLKIDAARKAAAENFIMLMQRLPMSWTETLK